MPTNEAVRAPDTHAAFFSAPLAEADPEVAAALTPSEIEEKFDLGYHTKHVDTIFRRVFGEDV